MVLQIFFLHLNKVVETCLILLFDTKDHFSHFLSFELVKASTSFTYHGVTTDIIICCFLPIIEDRCYKSSSHLALRLNSPIRLLLLHEVLILRGVLHKLGLFDLLKLRISLSAVTHTRRKLGSIVLLWRVNILLRSLALAWYSLSLLYLFGLRPFALIIDY